ncbi:Lipase/lipooxygenase PLAT/LH2 family protein [Citrus sinensis]|uniref:Lipase/lipooxygenase PLAT/LH2 family protein n=1 Tax=Citrus sinensis TaxID=2711 RepID=A0ACB8MUC7_CITSI|nr:Lipase/lipooxygenase PLAT/LH2 family protein [Citrus sinensis]KAH9789202.1 Lipase/lipooxygenase PLAT/LH2 family protein [Citrus sinensis]
MESVSLKQLISATNWRYPIIPLRLYSRNLSLHFQNRRFPCPLIRSKQSDFQDFQGYAKPKRLLPATEVKISTDTSPRTFSSFSPKESRSLFKRIPSSSMTYHSTKTEDSIDPDRMHFQRGSSDEFTFEGPRLGQIEALWISLESGQWRLRGISLTIIDACESSLEEDGEEKIQCKGYCYDFEVDDILLGEGSNASMVELRPSRLTELSGLDPFTFLATAESQSNSLSNAQISKEESLKEYADLKFSLLLYDAILILVGTSVTSFSIGESSALAFLIGGFSGFLYLLLLQRSIDGLPAPKSISSQPQNQFKSPLLSIALAVGISFLALKYSNISGDDVLPFVLTPKDLLVGMLGFLACKVAVVLAAFKTVPVSLKENK